MVVFESWWMYPHHTRLFEQPINELTERQKAWVNEVRLRSTNKKLSKPRTKREEKLQILQGKIEYAISQSKEKEHKPLFATKKKYEEKTIPETAVDVAANSDAPSFF